MSPLTRFRADDRAVPLPSATEYYGQRASVPGTLLVSEATAISSSAVGFANVPGIWTDEQVGAWRTISDRVHAHRSHIFMQLWATGRSAQPECIGNGTFDFASSSAVPMTPNDPVPRAMSAAEVHECVQTYAHAARNAIAAGMDGVELHAANGYLLDQFTQASCNQRRDEWGGSIEHRARFVLAVTEAVVDAVGAERVAVKLSPWGQIQGMGTTAHLVAQFLHVVSRLGQMRLAYLRLANSRWLDADPQRREDNEMFVRAWGKERPVILEGGYTGVSARAQVDGALKEYDVAIAFGRFFISNPDLPFRIRHNLPLQTYDRDTFYTPLQDGGYIDYPFSDHFISQRQSDVAAECVTMRPDAVIGPAMPTACT